MGNAHKALAFLSDNCHNGYRGTNPSAGQAVVDYAPAITRSRNKQAGELEMSKREQQGSYHRDRYPDLTSAVHILTVRVMVLRVVALPDILGDACVRSLPDMHRRHSLPPEPGDQAAAGQAAGRRQVKTWRFCYEKAPCFGRNGTCSVNVSAPLRLRRARL